MGEKRRRSREDRAARREELLDAATTAIRRDGADVSMDDIATEAGITKPILYSHFGDKAGLADALAERFSAELSSLFTEVWERVDEPRERVHRSIDAWVGFIEADPDVYQFLSEGSFGAGRRLDERRLVSELGSRVTRALGEWMRSQGADSGPAEPWAFGVLGMVHVATEWWLERQTMSRRDLVDYLTALLWSGLDAHTGGHAARQDDPAAAATPAARGARPSPGALGTGGVSRRSPRRPAGGARPGP